MFFLTSDLSGHYNIKSATKHWRSNGGINSHNDVQYGPIPSAKQSSFTVELPKTMTWGKQFIKKDK